MTNNITKTMRFNDIKAILTGAEVSYGTTVEDAIAFINKEVESLAKKNSAKSAKRTADSEQNETFKALIMNFLNGAEPEESFTATDVLNAVPEIGAAGFQNQKVTYLLRCLEIDKLVTSEKVKGRRVYKSSLNVDATEDMEEVDEG